ncbi:MAG: DUF6428 family protein [Bacteroidota bacterium]
MTTQEFTRLLTEKAELELQFEYAPGRYLPPAYHITEIKKVQTESVDCGGRPHQYQETVVQLWWDGKEQRERPMSARKAGRIFELVEAQLPLVPETEVFFEYGYGELRTSVYRAKGIRQTEEQLIVQLEVPMPECKPKVEWEAAQGTITCGGNTGCC